MKKILILLITLAFYPFAYAKSVDHYQRIHLSSAAEQQAENDLMTMTLLVRYSHQKSAKVAQHINKTMHEALGLLKEYKDIVVRTENYQINPIYKKERFIEWRGKQNLVLKSSNVEAMSKVTSFLLKKLQIQSQSYSLSFTKKEQIENTLIKKSLTALKKRAKIVQDSFGAKSYCLVNINISTHSSGPVYNNRYKARNYGLDPMMAASSVPVASQSGQSQVKVIVNGEIELVM
jgi:predicted secreted protein